MQSNELKAFLKPHEDIDYPDLQPEQRLAAVLVLLCPGDEGPELVFTRRSEHLPNHAGQISFPGGTIEPGDEGPVHTALRESEEEISLNSTKVEILGTLDWYTMPAKFVVLPVIGQLNQQQEFEAAPDEVAEIFSIPLRTLLDVSLYQSNTLTRNRIKRRFYFFEYKEYYVWGATAGILRSLALKLSG